MEPDVIPRPDGEAEVIDTPDITGPGLRSTERPDYSIQKNFREMLYGRKDTELDVFSCYGEELTRSHLRSDDG